MVLMGLAHRRSIEVEEMEIVMIAAEVGASVVAAVVSDMPAQEELANRMRAVKRLREERRMDFADCSRFALP